MEGLKLFAKFRRSQGLFVLLALFSFVPGIPSLFADGPKRTMEGSEAVVGGPASERGMAPGWSSGHKHAEVSSEICLDHEDWEKIQRAVHETVEHHLIGRKFIQVYGPLGAGAQSVPLDTYDLPSWANIDMLGEANSAVHPLKRDIIPIPLIYKDFWLFYRDIAAAKKCNIPLDLSVVTGAAAAVSKKEDDLIFNGSPEMGMPGLLNAEGRNVMEISDWSIIGNGFQDVVDAVERLINIGFSGPFALVVSPRLYAYLHRVYERTGQLEIKGVKELVKGGVYQSSVLKRDVAIVVAMGRMNLDLAVGANYKVEYWGSENLNHRFRVVGSSVPRIKRPQAICVLE
ncbi:MAG: bacteriocin [wastewater metagenome]|nr:bacteriocin [Candidatus Loosdrechtia aerotolerans]